MGVVWGWFGASSNLVLHIRAREKGVEPIGGGSPTQEGPFAQSSWAPSGDSRANIEVKLAILVLSRYPPPTGLDPVLFFYNIRTILV